MLGRFCSVLLCSGDAQGLASTFNTWAAALLPEKSHRARLDGSLDVFAGSLIRPLVSTAGVTVQNTSRSGTSIYQSQVPDGYFSVDGYRASLVISSDSVATNVDGFGYYMSNRSVSTGSRGNAVGLFGTTTCEVDGCASWGLNPTLLDGAVGGFTGTGMRRRLIGAEIDISATQTGTTVQGISLLGSSTVQPLGADGISCGSLGGPAKWTHCFVSNDGVTGVGVHLGSLFPSGTSNSPSQPIELVEYGLEGVGQQLQLQASSGALNVSSARHANYLALTPAATGNAVALSAQGTDKNVPLSLLARGTAPVQVLSPLLVSGPMVAGSRLDVSGELVLKQHTPSTSHEPCTVGTVVDDSNFHYSCVAPNEWKRAKLSSW
jgi:hypothetical protein